MQTTVPATGGPIDALVTAFLDASGAPTTDTDAPSWALSDPSLATLVVDPSNPQHAVIALSGAAGALTVTASFAANAATGSPSFVASGLITIGAAGTKPATSASIAFSGPGVVNA